MIGKLTVKQEAFCMAYIETGNASEAYRTAGYSDRQTPKALTENASKLLTKVLPRIEELQREHAGRHETTVDSLVAELDEARKKAMESNNGASAAVSAVLGKAKLLGLYTDKHEHTGKDGKPLFPPTITNDMTPHEASEAYARSLEHGHDD